MEEKTIFGRLVAQLLPVRQRELFGALIQRSVFPLANSSPGRRRPVAIPIDNQYITAGLRETQIERALKEAFLNAETGCLERGSRQAAFELCKSGRTVLELDRRLRAWARGGFSSLLRALNRPLPALQ